MWRIINKSKFYIPRYRSPWIFRIRSNCMCLFVTSLLYPFVRSSWSTYRLQLTWNIKLLAFTIITYFVMQFGSFIVCAWQSGFTETNSKRIHTTHQLDAYEYFFFRLIGMMNFIFPLFHFIYHLCISFSYLYLQTKKKHDMRNLKLKFKKKPNRKKITQSLKIQSIYIRCYITSTSHIYLTTFFHLLIMKWNKNTKHIPFINIPCHFISIFV